MGRRQVLRGLGGTAAGLAAVAAAGCGRVNAASAPARRAPGTLIWRVKSGPANTGGLGGQSVLAAGRIVYVAGTPLADGDCVTCAFDAATGKLAWRIAGSAGPLLTAGPGAVFGFQMTADQNGTEVAAFSAGTGRRMWTHHVGEFLDSAGDDGWAGYSHGTVYIAGSRNPEETTSKTFVGALDARTGRRLWGVTLTGMLQYPALSDGIVYASAASRVVALNAVTGTRLWESADVGANTGYLWVANRVVYGYLLTGIHGTVPFALDAATGKRLEHGFGSPVSRRRPVLHRADRGAGRRYRGTARRVRHARLETHDPRRGRFAAGRERHDPVRRRRWPRHAVRALRGNRVHCMDLPSQRLHRRHGGQQRHLVCRGHQRQRLRAADVAMSVTWSSGSLIIVLAGGVAIWYVRHKEGLLLPNPHLDDPAIELGRPRGELSAGRLGGMAAVDDLRSAERAFLDTGDERHLDCAEHQVQGSLREAPFATATLLWLSLLRYDRAGDDRHLDIAVDACRAGNWQNPALADVAPAVLLRRWARDGEAADLDRAIRLAHAAGAGQPAPASSRDLPLWLTPAWRAIDLAYAYLERSRLHTTDDDLLTARRVLRGAAREARRASDRGARPAPPGRLRAGTVPAAWHSALSRPGYPPVRARPGHDREAFGAPPDAADRAGHGAAGQVRRGPGPR